MSLGGWSRHGGESEKKRPEQRSGQPRDKTSSREGGTPTRGEKEEKKHRERGHMVFGVSWPQELSIIKESDYGLPLEERLRGNRRGKPVHASSAQSFPIRISKRERTWELSQEKRKPIRQQILGAQTLPSSFLVENGVERERRHLFEKEKTGGEGSKRDR